MPGKLAALTVFCVWSVGVTGLITALGRESCKVPVRAEASSPTIAAEAAGWTLRHWLPVSHALTPLIAEQLLDRGKRVGVGVEIFLVGDNRRLADQFRRRGWRVVQTTGPAEPLVEILAPDNALRWSGRFRGTELTGRDAVMLDDVVILQVARGDYVAPFVPVGCVTTLSSSPRARLFF